MVSETSWHDGHPVHHRRYPGLNKATWLRHVLDQVDIAAFHGAVIAGVCWYPIVDCPPWHRPFSKDRWSHGLIRSDLSVDAPLSAELRSLRTDCVRQDVGIDAALPYDGLLADPRIQILSKFIRHFVDRNLAMSFWHAMSWKTQGIRATAPVKWHRWEGLVGVVWEAEAEEGASGYYLPMIPGS